MIFFEQFFFNLLKLCKLIQLIQNVKKQNLFLFVLLLLIINGRALNGI